MTWLARRGAAGGFLGQPFWSKKKKKKKIIKKNLLRKIKIKTKGEN